MMNLLILDLDPRKAAIYHLDGDLPDAITHAAQFLSTAHFYNSQGARILSKHPRLYKPTEYKHQISKWVRARTEQYRWTYALFIALCDEYKFRFDVTHIADEKLRAALRTLPPHLRENGHKQYYDVTGFMLEMPKKYKDYSSAVASYRDYTIYERAFETVKMPGVTAPVTRSRAHWTNRRQPWWWPREDSEEDEEKAA